jgi:hypothetical protein
MCMMMEFTMKPSGREFMPNTEAICPKGKTILARPCFSRYQTAWIPGKHSLR